MIYDYYASSVAQKGVKPATNDYALASGFVDECTKAFSFAEIERAVADKNEKSTNDRNDKKAWKKQSREAEKRKNEARTDYRNQATKLINLQIPLHIEPDFIGLPNPSWFGMTVYFTMETPWYSKDDRPFHVLDNPVRKDRVFGLPFMSPASWKGLLRWACRMISEPSLKDKLDDWKEPNWIIHLFGNEKREKESDKLKHGSLVFYPTWFSRVGFEVINPHSRARRAGTQPIYYEVVPIGTEGCLKLLYAPMPGEMEREKINSAKIMGKLIDAIEQLLEIYGISAKRTVGWGAARIDKWEGFQGSGDHFFTTSVDDFKTKIKLWYSSIGGAR